MFELPEHGAPGVYYYAVHSTAAAAYASDASTRLGTPWWTLGDVVATDTPGLWQIVPEELTPGYYELFVHNGYGGEHAWSEPLHIAVLRREKEKDQPLIEVADLGAKGDDDQDDTAAIKSALKEAGECGGAVVLVPRGRFVVSEKLVIPPHVTLRGAGRELTALCMADTDDPPDAWIEGSHHFAIEDLTLYCNHHHHVISNNTAAAVHAPAAPIEDPETAGHVRLARVRVRADSFRGHLSPDKQEERARTPGPRDTIRLSGPDIRITDCDVYGSERSIYLHYAVGALGGEQHLLQWALGLDELQRL